MNMKRLLWGFILIAATALLAGCGGGGGGTSLMVGGERATQDLIDALQQDRDDQETRANTAEGQRNAAHMTLGAIRTALGLMADADQAAIETAITNLMNRDPEDAIVAQLRTQLELDADATPAMIMAAIQGLQDMAAMLPPTEDDNPAATTAAGTKRMAIATEAAQAATGGTVGQDGDGGADAGLGGSAAPAADAGSYTLAIERDRAGKTVTVTVEGATDADDVNFVQAGVIDAQTTMHTRTMDAESDGNVMEEVAMVTTDIEGPTATAFSMVHTLDTSTDTTNDTPDATNEAIAVDQTDADIVALVMSAAFVPGAGDSTQLRFAFDDAATTDMDEADEVMGTYDGGMGTYRCNAAAACTVTLDSDGMITAMSDGWVFIPASDASVDVADGDYLHYGFWLKRTTDSDGAVTYNEVETFAGSSVPVSGDLGAVTGRATYNGGATGVYVRNVTGQDGAEILARSGHFRADAELRATFGQVLADPTDTTSGTIAPNMLNTLRGTIDNFRLSDNSDLRPGWSVALEGDITAGTGTASGTAEGGMGDGSFTATFHGSTDPDADGTADTQPGSVVGEFNAGFSNGSVAGAFGARK